jgi:hypothetical protein
MGFLRRGESSNEGPPGIVASSRSIYHLTVALRARCSNPFTHPCGAKLINASAVLLKVSFGFRVRKRSTISGDSGSVFTKGIGSQAGSFVVAFGVSFCCTRRQSSRIYCSASEISWLSIDLAEKGISIAKLYTIGLQVAQTLGMGSDLF